jgi:hypothetical protein
VFLLMQFASSSRSGRNFRPQMRHSTMPAAYSRVARSSWSFTDRLMSRYIILSAGTGTKPVEFGVYGSCVT